MILRPEELPMTFADNGDKAYTLLHEGEPVLNLYVTSTTYTIGWPSTFNAGTADETGRVMVARLLDQPPPTHATIATTDPHAIRDYALPTEFSAYKGDLVNGSVGFLRLDGTQYAFTASWRTKTFAVRVARSLDATAFLTWLGEQAQHQSGALRNELWPLFTGELLR